MRYLLYVLVFLLSLNSLFAQQSKYIELIADSEIGSTPVYIDLPIDSGFLALDRIEMTNDGKELFYGVRTGYDSTSLSKIVSIKYENNSWGNPIVIDNCCGAPTLSSDNKTLFYQYDDSTNPKGVFASKVKRSWSETQLFCDTLTESHYLQSPASGIFYYCSTIDKTNKYRDIFRTEICNQDTVFQRLNLTRYGDCCIDFLVSEDESFIILSMWNHEKDNYKFFGTIDLFISFRKNDNNWTNPVNLGENINGLSQWTHGPFVTNDNKYLIFTSYPKKAGSYAVRIDKRIEELKKQAQIN